MNPTKIAVLESQSGVSKSSGKSYTIALVRIVGGRTGKIFSDVDLTPYVGKEILVEIEHAPNREMFLSARIARVSK